MGYYFALLISLMLLAAIPPLGLTLLMGIGAYYIYGLYQEKKDHETSKNNEFLRKNQEEKKAIELMISPSKAKADLRYHLLDMPNRKEYDKCRDLIDKIENKISIPIYWHLGYEQGGATWDNAYIHLQTGHNPDGQIIAYKRYYDRHWEDRTEDNVPYTTAFISKTEIQFQTDDRSIYQINKSVVTAGREKIHKAEIFTINQSNFNELSELLGKDLKVKIKTLYEKAETTFSKIEGLAFESKKTVINCVKCNRKLRVPTGRRLKISCPHCGYTFERNHF